MNAFNSILAVADSRTDGHAALHRAAALARQHGARLHIVDLAPAPRPGAGNERRGGWRGWWRAAAALMRGGPRLPADAPPRGLELEIAERYGLCVSTEAARGDAATHLLAASRAADLVVIGQHRRGSARGWLRAALLRRVLRHCERAVLVVRTAPDAAYQRVLVPLDCAYAVDCSHGAQRAQDAVAIAARVAGDGGLHLFHAIDPAGLGATQGAKRSEAATRQARARARAEVHARMRRTVWRLGLQRAAVDYTVTHGTPARATPRQVRRIGADLLVHQRDSAYRAGGLGSGSGCDLLVVPSARRQNPSGALCGGCENRPVAA